MANTKSLLHFNGSDASTSFPDDYGKIWTARGNAQLDTAQQKFGTASLLLDGTGDSTDTPSSTDFAPGTGDFTADFWVRFNDLTANQAFLGRTQDGTHEMKFRWIQASTLMVFQYYVVSDLAEYNFTWNPSTNTWYHVAVVRNGSNFFIFIDGVSQSLNVVVAVGTNDLSDISAVMEIGHEADTASYLNGWIDEFRWSLVAVWTSNFTPPTIEYTTTSTSSSTSTSTTTTTSTSTTTTTTTTTTSTSTSSSTTTSTIYPYRFSVEKP